MFKIFSKTPAQPLTDAEIEAQDLQAARENFAAIQRRARRQCQTKTQDEMRADWEI